MVGDPRTVVARKRDGMAVPAEELEAFVLAYARGEVSDALAAAFLMACVIRGMTAEETLAMCRAMVASGATVSFDLDRPVVDKHSTGGVADGVTLVFAPLAAALGLGVAKLSGRGLGHTGGTLDKLEAIPGLRTDLGPERIEDQVRRVGCAVAAQSPAIVPADGALYALRDATATVPSVPLIAASVMAKKLAVGSDLIVLDVKAGSGAFMKTVEEARALADACRALARDAGRRADVAVTDMSQPLGEAVGNALDVREAIEILRGERAGRLRDLVVWFAARALARLGSIAHEEGVRRAEAALASGAALERFRAMVEAQGGDPGVVDDPVGVLPRAPLVLPVLAPGPGVLAAVDAEAIGQASVELGAGRRRKGDPVDPAVGLIVGVKIGDRVEAGQPIGEVHARERSAADRAAAALLAALSWSEEPVTPPPLVHLEEGRS
ncbi:MAG: thymidine phosphorylase [Actinomycetota bacterium]|jgi:pyrimidine-nucleoside phosphorylase|nr:MAG: thymidine phosphorylase [Actinomycetota bacterium]